MSRLPTPDQVSDAALATLQHKVSVGEMAPELGKRLGIEVWQAMKGRRDGRKGPRGTSSA